ncbi:DUF3823 domain-containing protein [Pinibacter aurantiacus]|uniref:DUF3823 domain-containing protein n=1 Tax=Pinibacter aurantiacus TaxID=2851599 RepID=A0A9E2W366_9BACT|nr:DUF3823 domain-containing protein [Pinibacter aurantiacus]MBV4355908.1 DUF3823 domain-containing protein [Pinibacter aurantiacus]
MKKIIIAIALLGFLVLGNSCSKENDSYPAPSETLTGNVIDSVTGKPIQTEQPDGIRLQMLETSWSDNPIPWYFWIKPDGTFNNDKIFAATYKITPVDGPFFPVEGKSVVLKGKVNVDFIVTPFLNVEIVGKVQQNGNDVNLSYKISRAKAAYKITDARVFVSNTPYVSNGSNDNVFSTQNNNDLNGTPDETVLTTVYNAKITGLKSGRTYYVRVGARTNDNVSKRYNYSEEQAVTMP